MKLRRALFAENGRNSLSKAADDVVLFAGDDLAALLGCLQDDLLVEGLDGADVDNAGMNALFREILRSRQSFRNHKARCDDGNIIAVRELLALTDLEGVALCVVEYRRCQTAQADIDRAFIGVGCLHGGSCLYIVAR